MQDAFNALSEPTAPASLADILDRKRFGMAIAEMIKMIATVIRSSISENPDSLFLYAILSSPPLRDKNIQLSSPLSMSSES